MPSLLKGGLVRGKSAYKEIGHYTLATGKQDVQFDFTYRIMDVLISSVSTDFPVCQGDLNWFAITQLPNGFIIHADVKTDSATVTWVTVEDTTHHGND